MILALYGIGAGLYYPIACLLIINNELYDASYDPNYEYRQLNRSPNSNRIMVFVVTLLFTVPFWPIIFFVFFIRYFAMGGMFAFWRFVYRIFAPRIENGDQH